jgi:hypothetical protein
MTVKAQQLSSAPSVPYKVLLTILTSHNAPLPAMHRYLATYGVFLANFVG